MAVLAAISLLCGFAALLGPDASAQGVSDARAAEVVVLFELEALRPDLCAALRIQLTDVAEVRCRAEPAAGALSERIASASRAVAREQLRLAILLERDPDPRRVRMLLVGASESQAVIAIESIEDRPAPDVDRSLALKVRDAIEVLSTRPASVAPAAALALTLAPKSRELGVEGAARKTLTLLFESGAVLSLGARARAAGLLGAGARMQHGARYGELMLRGQVSSSLRASNARFSVVDDEWGGALSLRGGRELGRFSLGALGELDVVRMRALGVGGDGSKGERKLALVRLGIGLDLRCLLLSGPAPLRLRFAPTLQIDPVAQRFEIDRQEALSLGRAHAWLPLSLLIELPLARAGANDGV